MINRLSLLFTFALALFIAAYVTLPTSAAPELQANYGTKTVAFSGITSTTRSCASFPYADTAFVQLVADVTVANTSTVATQYTSNNTNFTVGETLSASVTADTPTVASGNIYTVTLIGQSTCIVVTPVNTNPITITAYLAAPARTN